MFAFGIAYLSSIGASFFGVAVGYLYLHPIVEIDYFRTSFDESGTALLLTIFALQDSFGTACNVNGDGALTLITDTYEKKIAE